MWPVLFTHWSHLEFPVSLVLSSVPYELKPRIFNSGGSAKDFFFPLLCGCLSKSTKIVEIIGAFAEAASLTTEGDFDA